MKNAASFHYKVQAKVIKALAHPTRLFIVDELSHGERCVCELTAQIGAEMPTVSRHLSLLREAGIIQNEKRGTQVFYKLAAPCVVKFLTCLERLNPAFSTTKS